MSAITVDGAVLDRVTLAALGVVPPSLESVGGLELPLAEDVDLLDPEGAPCRPAVGLRASCRT